MSEKEKTEEEIEVEKTYRLTDEEFAKLIEEAELEIEETVRETQYDFPNYSLFVEDKKLRKRDGVFELKIGVEEYPNTMIEIVGEEKVKEHLGIKGDLEEYVAKHMLMLVDYEFKRRIYKKEGLKIETDELMFGSNPKFQAIEKKVKNIKDASVALQEILSFAKKNGIESRKVPSKRGEFLKEIRPDLYKKLYEERRKNKELKNAQNELNKGFKMR